MKVSIAYANQKTQIWQQFEVDENATVEDVIVRSGLLEVAPDVDIKKNKIGIFGKLTRLNSPVQEGDRVEVYHAITRVLDDEDEDDDDD